MDRVCICFLHSYTRWSALVCGDDNDFLGRRPTNSDGEYDLSCMIINTKKSYGSPRLGTFCAMHE